MSDQIEMITPRQLQDKLEKNKQVHIIDVREDEEVATGIIPTAQHIRLSEIPERYYELDNTKEYIMVCRSGRRSRAAAVFLHDLGFKVKNMDGGMLKWEGIIQ